MMSQPFMRSLLSIFKNRWRFGLIGALSVCVLLPTLVLALDPKKAITQYVHDVWTVEDGLPQNSILAITQTRNGYLWIGTWGGLARFDGIRFTVFNRENTQEIKSNYIYALYEDYQRNLWIGAAGGALIRLRDGKFTAFTTNDGLSSNDIRSICEDSEGNLWIGTGGGGLNRFRDGKFTSLTSKNGLSSDWVYSVYEDRGGSLWIGTSSGLNRFEDGKITTYTSKEGLPSSNVWAIAQDREGCLWVGTLSGLYRFRNGKFSQYTARKGLSHKWVHSINKDSEGNLWIGTDGGGINRFQDGKFASFTTSDGLSHNTVSSMYEDREGNLWVGTWGGLNRFKDGILTVFGKREGLSYDWTRSVYEDLRGSLWVGTYGGGLNRFKDGKFTHFTTKDGLSGNIVAALYGDHQGNIWCPTEDGGLSRFKDGKFTRYGTIADLFGNEIFTHYSMKANLPHEQVSAIYEDRQGNLWIGTYGGGLTLFKGGEHTHYSAKDELSRNIITAIYEDREGNLWVGAESGLNKFKDGKFTPYATKKGLSHITSIFEDGDGNLWVTTRGDGLIRFKQEQVITYTTQEGLFDNTLTTVLDDEIGNLWIGSFKGIFRVSKKDLADLAVGKIRVVTSISYGKAEGMRSIECNSQQPSGWKSKDGRLWFPTINGLVMVDPAGMKHNTLAPPVLIEQVIFQNRPMAFAQNVALPPGKRELEFHYTALSFLNPKKVRFKYKLEGYNDDWVEAGTRRVAYYTQLAPGRYRFRVIACNNDGVWNETGAALELYLESRFYETRWFYALWIALSAISLILAGIGWYHQRVKRDQRRRDTYARQLIDSQERDRKRIAGDLHDSTGQLVNLISRHALDGLGEPENYELVTERFAKIASYAGEAIEEMRTVAYNLRPPEIDRLSLTQALEALVERFKGLSVIEFTCDVDSIDSALADDGKVHFYRIVQECFNNIVHHSQATKASLIVRREAESLRIEIRDNGQGFDPAARSNGNRPGLGLPGITERTRLLGGKAEIRSAPGQGTEVTIAITLPETKS